MKKMKKILKKTGLSKYYFINPFICLRLNSDVSVKDIRNNVIFILEALEEKQKHFVTPTLPLVQKVIKVNMEHKLCGNCVNNEWIYCIFIRILLHSNNFIIK